MGALGSAHGRVHVDSARAADEDGGLELRQRAQASLHPSRAIEGQFVKRPSEEQTGGVRGDPPGFGEAPDAAAFVGVGFITFANAVSADGSVVVGFRISDSGTEAFRWTQDGGSLLALGFAALFLALGLLPAEPALALCQRADGTYTNSCQGSDREVKGGHVSRAEHHAPLPAVPTPADPQASDRVQVEVLPQRETDPRTYWRDQRRAALERLEDEEKGVEYDERRLARCRRAAGLRYGQHCGGLKERVESSRQRLEEARQRVEEQLFEDCRHDPVCEPGYLR